MSTDLVLLTPGASASYKHSIYLLCTPPDSLTDFGPCYIDGRLVSKSVRPPRCVRVCSDWRHHGRNCSSDRTSNPHPKQICFKRFLYVSRIKALGASQTIYTVHHLKNHFLSFAARPHAVNIRNKHTFAHKSTTSSWYAWHARGWRGRPNSVVATQFAMWAPSQQEKWISLHAKPQIPPRNGSRNRIRSESN